MINISILYLLCHVHVSHLCERAHLFTKRTFGWITFRFATQNVYNSMMQRLSQIPFTNEEAIQMNHSSNGTDFIQPKNHGSVDF